MKDPQSLTRRAILQGMAVLPFLPALNQMARATGPHKKCCKVLLHGSYVLVMRANGIDVLVANLKDEHKYKAGRWGNPNNLFELQSQGMYDLKGVTGVDPKKKGSDQEFDDELNVVIKNGNPNTSANLVYCQLHLPLPNEIHSLRLIGKRKKEPFFLGQPTLNLKGLSMLCCLVYQDYDEKTLALGDHRIDPTPNSEGSVNIHVFAEPERHQPHDPLDVVNKISGSQLIANTAYDQARGKMAEKKDLPHGVGVDEQKGLEELSDPLKRNKGPNPRCAKVIMVS